MEMNRYERELKMFEINSWEAHVNTCCFNEIMELHVKRLVNGNYFIFPYLTPANFYNYAPIECQCI
nr:hypothetical protein Itr_chr14CG02880 [Ipomoea trifida]